MECPLCRGRRSCPECDGFGEHVCPTCHGEDQECSLCQGKGVESCHHCQGRGTCPRCRGEGEIEPNDSLSTFSHF